MATPPGTGRRERIGEQRRAAQGEKKDYTELLAGLGSITLLLIMTACTVLVPLGCAYGIQSALAAYGIHEGGIQAPLTLVLVFLTLVIVGVSQGTRYGTRGLPAKFAAEIEKLVRR
jgi:Na+/H+ antiporter NhaC